MHTYEIKKFDLGELDGLSKEQIDVHIGLYEGYVKHVNLLQEQVKDLTEKDVEKYAYAIMELRRRLGFEWNGMRMHEYYFAQLEGDNSEVDRDSALTKSVSEKYGSWGAFITHFMQVGMTRGIGWTVLYYDAEGKTPHVAWVADHELGQLAGAPIILAMDMWEHAFMVDYTPSEKKAYIKAFFRNVNWNVVEKRSTDAS